MGARLRIDDWLEDCLGSPKTGETVLVLCRSRATVNRVRRFMAERGGWIGADVVTPHGLVASIAREPLGRVRPPAVPDLPVDNPIHSLIRGRPGLISAARRWVRRLREIEACGHTAEGAPEWLHQLAASTWEDQGESAALSQALERLASDPKRPTESHRYDRIVTIGFDMGSEALEPAARAVAQSIGSGGDEPALRPAQPRSIRALSAPDAAAEVRLVCEQVASESQDTLVLVSEATTARRLRDALNRNGLACGFTDPPSAGASAIGGLALRMVPWFEAPDPPLRLSDVAWVFGHRAIGRDLLPAAAEALEGDRVALGLEPEDVRLGRRRLIAMLHEAKVLDAPLSRWLLRLRILRQDVARRSAIRGAALALEVRLRLLEGRSTGVEPERVFGDPSVAFDDFDALVAELLGEEADALRLVPGAHTLGALRKYLTDLRPRVHDDAAARAVLGQLRERDTIPADPATAREALSSPVDPGSLAVGVDVITYDDWDGRPASQLILLDVHHKGLARRPTPDPLLDEAEQGALQELAGQALVDYRISQVHRAVAAADRALAVVAERDSAGRDLVAPIQLDLVYEEPSHVGSYGFAIPLPETARKRSLLVRRSDAPAEPRSSDPVLRALAIQANVEWYRAGRGPLGRPVPAIDGRASLDRRLAVLRPIAPEWAMPWLGHAEGVPEAALPNRRWSNSRLFEPMSACLYQAFGRAVLNVKPPEELAEDLDPREIGTAIHDALEHLGSALRLRVPESELESARDTVVASLRANTAAKLEALADDLQGLSEARRVAVQGRIARWNAHWPSWARSRVRVQSDDHDYKAMMDFVRGHPYVAKSARALAELVPATQRYDERTRVDWVVNTAQEIKKGKTDPSSWSDKALAREGKRWGGLTVDLVSGLRAFVETQAFRDVSNVLVSAEVRAKGAGVEVEATAVEVPFGRPEEPPGVFVSPFGEIPIDLGEVEVPMGRAPIQLSGRIDRVIVSYRKQRPYFEVVDYKTGRSAPGNPWFILNELLDGRRPQLVIYAMALQAAERAGNLEDGLKHAIVAAVGWDHVRFTEEDPTAGDRQPADNKVGRFLVDTATLDAIAERIGVLVDEGRDGRWTLSPRPAACPSLDSWGLRCDLEGACRMRGLPQPDVAP